MPAPSDTWARTWRTMPRLLRTAGSRTIARSRAAPNSRWTRLQSTTQRPTAGPPSMGRCMTSRTSSTNIPGGISSWMPPGRMAPPASRTRLARAATPRSLGLPLPSITLVLWLHDGPTERRATEPNAQAPRHEKPRQPPGAREWHVTRLPTAFCEKKTQRRATQLTYSVPLRIDHQQLGGLCRAPTSVPPPPRRPCARTALSKDCDPVIPMLS
mmetsp:Transcript_65042/g.107996  ORF Transcript_65042/g.107996 Transcript_65042/m.107996 type:complete len:213 (+) Transcript_65042:125-763(+)